MPVLQRLRWEAVPFANLRYANSPGDRLDWECGNRTELEEFQKFDCDWQVSKESRTYSIHFNSPIL